MPRTPTEVVGWLTFGVIPGFLLGVLQARLDDLSIRAVIITFVGLIVALSCIPESGLLTRHHHAGKRWVIALEIVFLTVFAVVVIAPPLWPFWYTVLLAMTFWFCGALLHWRNFEGADVAPRSLAAAVALFPFGVFLIALGRAVSTSSESAVMGLSSTLQGIAVVLLAAVLSEPGLRRTPGPDSLFALILGVGFLLGAIPSIRLDLGFGGSLIIGLCLVATAGTLYRRRTPWHQLPSVRILPYGLLFLSAEGCFQAWTLSTGQASPQSTLGAETEATMALCLALANALIALGLALRLSARVGRRGAGVGWILVALALGMWASVNQFTFSNQTAAIAYGSGALAMLALANDVAAWRGRRLASCLGWLNGRPQALASREEVDPGAA